MNSSRLQSIFSSKIILPTILFLFTFLIQLGVTFHSQMVLEHTKFLNLPIHTSVEFSGTVIAIIVAKLLLQLEKNQQGSSFNYPISAALLGMGLIDGLHALLPPGNLFVWTHAMASIVGSIFFISIWLPSVWLKILQKFMPAIAVLMAITLGIHSLYYPEQVPLMLVSGKYTTIFSFIKTLGSVLTILAAIKLFFSYRKCANPADLIFFFMCLLFGLAGLMFWWSPPWEEAWWSWHILRLIAYISALRFIFYIIESHQQLLENKVSVRTFELASKNIALENAHNHINSELEIARNLQIDILPINFPTVLGCDGAARMLPATTMGGDFYDYIELPNGKIGLVMADVSGKGVPAAFFMAVARTNLRLIAYDSLGPSECLKRTNNILCTQNPMYLFVTIFYAVFDPVMGLLTYANGGHNPPVLRHIDGSIELLASFGDTALGVIEEIDFNEEKKQLSPGDSLILYTDGVTEAFNPEWEEHGEERMLEQIRLQGDGSAKNLVTAIFDSVIEFAGIAPQSDDITITVLNWQHPARKAIT